MKRFRLLLGGAALLVAAPTLAQYAHPTVTRTNHPPVISAPASVVASEGTLASFPVTASDPDGDHVDLQALSLPVGATFLDSGNGSGTFTWTPCHGQEGSCEVTFAARDDLGMAGAPASVSITVAKVNRAPSADPSGPYSGAVGVPIAFDGTASSDLDGDALAYTWQFGDGAAGTGPLAHHTYASGGSFVVTLTVNDGFLSHAATTSATIRDAFPARALTSKADGIIKLRSGQAAWCVEIEPVGDSFLSSAVVPSTLSMRLGTGQIYARAGKEGPGADEDEDGIEELIACFAMTDLRALFAGLPRGRHPATVTLEGDLSTGGKMRTTLTVEVVSVGGALAATLSPNPLNPEGTLTFTTGVAGRVNVSVFDLRGRLLRTLLEEQRLSPGRHDVNIDGTGAAGSRLASGVYFYRIEAAEGVETGRFVIMK